MTGGAGADRLVIDDIHDLAEEHPWGADGGGIDTLVVADRFAHSLAESLPGLTPEGKATFVLGWEVGVTLPGGAEPYAQQVNSYIENVSLQGPSITTCSATNVPIIWSATTATTSSIGVAATT